jgi:hypothetical protein
VVDNGHSFFEDKQMLRMMENMLSILPIAACLASASGASMGVVVLIGSKRIIFLIHDFRLFSIRIILRLLHHTIKTPMSPTDIG